MAQRLKWILRKNRLFFKESQKYETTASPSVNVAVGKIMARKKAKQVVPCSVVEKNLNSLPSSTLMRWMWVWGQMCTFKPETSSMYKWSFSKCRFFSLPFKPSSVSPHTAYNSHIQMAGWRKDWFWLLSHFLLNFPFLKTIQLKPIVLGFCKALDI